MTLVLLKALAKRNLLELRRYGFNTIGLVLVLYSAFLVVFLGLRAVGGRQFAASDSPSAVVVGFVLFFLVQQSYQELTNQLSNEFSQGTIEQFAMSRAGLLVALGLEFFVTVGTYLVFMAVAIVPMMATTGRWLNADVLSLAPLVVLTVAQVAGIGLAMGGLAMVFKRITGPAQLVQFAFIGLLTAPIDDFPAVKLLPITLGFRLIRRVMVDELPIWRLPLGDLALLVLLAGVYLGAGALVFQRMDRAARDRGLLGQY